MFEFGGILIRFGALAVCSDVSWSIYRTPHTPLLHKTPLPYEYIFTATYMVNYFYTNTKSNGISEMYFSVYIYFLEIKIITKNAHTSKICVYKIIHQVNDYKHIVYVWNDTQRAH